MNRNLFVSAKSFTLIMASTLPKTNSGSCNKEQHYYYTKNDNYSHSNVAKETKTSTHKNKLLTTKSSNK